jgi:hypothetical protein
VAWHSPEYRRYLKSPEWQERKRQYFSRLPRRCAACGTYKRIHLHHSSYERLTREPDSDLWPLCFRCHRNVHQANASGRFENLEAAHALHREPGEGYTMATKASTQVLGMAHPPGDSSWFRIARRLSLNA